MFILGTSKVFSTKDSAQSSAYLFPQREHIHLLHPKRNIMVFITFLTVVCPKTPIFIFCKEASSLLLPISMSLRISAIAMFEPFPILFKQGINTERVIILCALFSLCRLLTLNTIFKVIRLSGTNRGPIFSYTLYTVKYMKTKHGEKIDFRFNMKEYLRLIKSTEVANSCIAHIQSCNRGKLCHGEVSFQDNH